MRLILLGLVDRGERRRRQALLLRNGKPVSTREEFDAAALARRDAQAAVGQLADGRIVLVAVDGNQPGYSVGVSSFELAQAMAGLGAVTAASLASGDAVTAAFDGGFSTDRGPRAADR